MTMWTGIVLIVLISLGFDYLRTRAKQQGLNGRQRVEVDALREELLKLQERVINLEAIVIEEEKKRPFRSL
ncbi:hypothetical protein [Aeromonas diversa]|uniref:Phage shock protein B n=1 Tax=Aeromonas diversa CDC 2478-85 TaxID=1268237 RepID=N9VK38_9GAMM|nr:hypothetical protein [Aeromonas diversa]ENY71701.1 hypothetical protein G114_11871 [Aeromonas diversa CDC 2478-85]